MAEDDQAAAELRASRGDAGFHLGIGKAEIFLRQRLPFGDVFLLKLREKRNERSHGSTEIIWEQIGRG